MFFLFKNGKIIVACILIASLAAGMHKLDVNRIEALHRNELQAQVSSSDKRCASDKALTKEVYDEYERKLNDHNEYAGIFKRVYSNTCILFSSNTTIKHDGITSQGELTGSRLERDTRVSAERMIDFFTEVEKYRLQLMSCQSFITKVWASRKQ